MRKKNFRIFLDPLKFWDTVDSKLWFATLCEFLIMPSVYPLILGAGHTQFVTNMFLLKNPQFLPNHNETLSK